MPAVGSSATIDNNNGPLAVSMARINNGLGCSSFTGQRDDVQHLSGVLGWRVPPQSTVPLL